MSPATRATSGSCAVIRVHYSTIEGTALACLPHLGQIDQTIDIEGHVLHADQLEGLSIRMGTIAADLSPLSENEPNKFRARLTLKAADVAQATYLAITFEMSDFRQPNETDTRLLGANIRRFTCQPDAAAS